MYPFYFEEHGYPFGAEVYQDLIVSGALTGVIQTAGAWFAFEDKKFQLKGQGKEKFAHAIADAGAYEHIKNLVFEAAGVHLLFKGIDE